MAVNRARRELLGRVLDAAEVWEERWGTPAGRVTTDPQLLEHALARFTARMDGNIPFFHPRYAAQVLKPPSDVALAGYLAAMIVNPNNHAVDASPVTSPMEVEAMRAIADMFGLPAGAVGHLTSSGTIANLEALWVARELAPGRVVVHADTAHYTHARMCSLLGVSTRSVPSDADGRLDRDALEAECARGDVGTVILTAGTTGVGAIDPIEHALDLRERYGVRIHVDAAYGGFHTLLGHPDLRAIAHCDSVVVDPHKHGLQPYGCGSVLFRDPCVIGVYAHDSPYTYFTSADLHLGEISLECSRAGAAAAALWLTLQVFPLEREWGLGPILAAGVRAAADLAERLGRSSSFRVHVAPALDIVTFIPALESMTAIDAASERLVQAGVDDAEDPLWLSTLRVSRREIVARHPDVEPDAEACRILRCALMKPEHGPWVASLAERLERLTTEHV